VEQAETEAIKTALSATQGRRAEAAELLGISRKTLWEKIKHHGITVE
jgi:transcriptional regulator of acetoin/glycerol metabolism